MAAIPTLGGRRLLLDDYGGTPAAPNGTALHDHLARLPAGGITPGPAPAAAAPAASAGPAARKPKIALTAFRSRVRPGGAVVSFALRSPVACIGTLSGRTARRYALAAAKPKRRQVGLGSVRFTLPAGKARTVVLALSKPGRRLLAAKRSLKARFTITLQSPGAARTVLHRGLTLKLPPHRHHGGAKSPR